MKRKDGFTLAEVLITLTIIGVISALTLPAIQSNTAASRNRATLKNTMAIISQAAQNNMATEGWNFSHATESCADDDNEARTHNSMDNYTVCGLLNSNLTGETFLGSNLAAGRPQNGTYRKSQNAPFYNYTSVSAHVYYQLSNGAIFIMHGKHGPCVDSENGSVCPGFIDVDGLAGPHREITCANNVAPHYLLQDNPFDRSRTCEVERTTNADIFPVIIHGTTVELASDAARSFLNAR